MCTGHAVHIACFYMTNTRAVRFDANFSAKEKRRIRTKFRVVEYFEPSSFPSRSKARLFILICTFPFMPQCPTAGCRVSFFCLDVEPTERANCCRLYPRGRTIPCRDSSPHLLKVCILYRKEWYRCGVYQRVLRQRRRSARSFFQKSYVSIYRISSEST